MFVGFPSFLDTEVAFRCQWSGLYAADKSNVWAHSSIGLAIRERPSMPSLILAGSSASPPASALPHPQLRSTFCFRLCLASGFGRRARPSSARRQHPRPPALPNATAPPAPCRCLTQLTCHITALALLGIPIRERTSSYQKVKLFSIASRKCDRGPGVLSQMRCALMNANRPDKGAVSVEMMLWSASRVAKELTS